MLSDAFSITEETNAHLDKDTARLLRAGASQVFWLRASRNRLREGLAALLDVVGPRTVSICESNSLRNVVEPGLFLLVTGPGQNGWKDSARRLREHADRIVFSENGKFSLDLDRVRLVDGRWTLLEKATAIVMAGGASRRMGTDKSMLPINGRPLIENLCGQLAGNFEQILISANDAEKFAFLGFEVIPDKVPGQGPLMGIVSALAASANRLNFVVACDIPHIRLAFVRRMLRQVADGNADIIIPMTREGQCEPLFAVYRKHAIQTVNQALSWGHRKISQVFSLCNVEYIELETDIPNINTTAEYEELKQQLGI
ncbi:MAG: molybdenum cofactor guanylyltransferase [Sedimentisphaerales bacterium]